MWSAITRLATGATLSGILSFAALLLILKELTLEDYGTLALIVSFGALLRRIVNAQTEQAIIKFCSPSNVRANRAYHEFLSAFLIVELVISVALFLIYEMVAYFLSNYINWIAVNYIQVMIYGLSLIGNVNAWVQGVFRVTGKFGVYSLVTTILPLVRIVILLCFVWLQTDFDLLLVVCIWVGSEIVSSILIGTLGLREVGLNNLRVEKTIIYRLAVARTYVKNSVRDGWARAAKELDLQIVGLILDEVAAGILKVVKQFSWIPQVVIDGSNKYVFGELAKGVSRSEMYFMIRVSLLISALVAILSIGIIAVGNHILDEIFNKRIDGLEYFLALALSASLVWSLVHPLSGWFLANGWVAFLFKLHSALAIVSAALSYVLTSRYGVQGPIMTGIVYQALWAAICIFYYMRQRKY